MIEVIDAQAARQALAAGRLVCPCCGGILRPWGRTRDHSVVAAEGVITVRLDRARCRSCSTTHVVLPATLIPRRAYPLSRIAAALAAAGQGAGSRSVATHLGVPAGTVRAWLRRAPRQRRAAPPVRRADRGRPRVGRCVRGGRGSGVRRWR
jgi:transposase-like protein